MFSVRRIFVVSDTIAASGVPSIIFSRKFSTVENRHMRLFQPRSNFSSYQDTYDRFTDDQVVQHFYTETIAHGIWEKGEDVVCLEPTNNFVFSNNEFLDPMMYIKKGSFFYVCVPLIEDTTYFTKEQPQAPPSLQGSQELFDNFSEKSKIQIAMPYLTATLALLQDISSFLPANTDLKARHIAELGTFVAQAIPFGKPSETNSQNIFTIIKQGFVGTEDIQSKRPAWKPFLFKGKQKIELKIQDRIRCIQYQKPNLPDQLVLNGGIIGKMDLEKTPEVTIPLSNVPEILHASFDSSVQLPGEGVEPSALLQKIVCTPPLDHFILCKYQILCKDFVAPLKVSYQMRVITPKEVKLGITVQLLDKKKNNFQYCEIELPFPNCGKVLSLDAVPTVGSVTLSPDQNTLKWNIGQKFSSRNFDATLPATIFFDSIGISQNNEDFGSSSPQNCFARLKFKMVNETVSGISIDTAGVKIYPATKVEIRIEKETVTDEFIVWNSLATGNLSH